MDREQLYLDRLRKALDAVKALKAHVADLEQRGPIAIVGAACRLPGGVTDLDGLWRLLESGVDPLEPIPADRWALDDWHDPDPDAPGRTHVREGGFIGDLSAFDAAFFGIAPREAAVLDPQHRLLLEVAWEALEHAAIAPDALAGTATGVFAGISTADHRKLLERRPPEAIDAWVGTGNVGSTAVGRLAYALDLRGPALALDTACSSSLIAVHLAVRALRAGDCDVALAGGVNVLLDPEGTVYFSKLGALSPTGRCRSFSADADGYVRSEGCGMVVLKRLADAERDGDPVLAVIRGTATNQDGRSNGLTAPSAAAQAAVVRAALRDAGARPDEVAAVECHATGTPLGDPIEVEALTQVFDGPVALGALKSVIGHAEAAAGVAGVLKAMCALRHRRLPPNLHFTAPNPHIAWGALQPAPAPVRGLIGVSSFGFGGSNAHVVLGPAPARSLPATSSRVRTLALSAHTERSLRALAGRWAATLRARPAELDDLCHTAATARVRQAHTLVVTGDADGLASALDHVAAGGAVPTGAWPDPGPGRRTQAPTTVWDRQRHWSVDIPRPRGATDPLDGLRWRIDWVPVEVTPAVASPAEAIPVHRDATPLVVPTDDPAGVAALAAHHRVTVTVVVGPPVVAADEDRLEDRNGWHAPRLRPASRGRPGSLTGRTVGATTAALAALARDLGATVHHPPHGDEDLLVTHGPPFVATDAPTVHRPPTTVLVADVADWLSDDPDAARATATAVRAARAAGAHVLRLAEGHGFDPLTDHQRRAALAEAVEGDTWVMALDRRRFGQTWPALAHRALLRQVGDAPTPEVAPPTDPDALRAVVRRAACEVLALASLRDDRSLPELGLDSVMALELRNRLEQATGVRLAATAAFDHPTVDALVDAVGAALGWDAVDALSDAEAEAALLAELDALGG